MKNTKTAKLWGDAFTTTPEEAVIAFTAGRDVQGREPADNAFISYDLWVNKAHCLMLYKQHIIDFTDAEAILQGLQDIEALVQTNSFSLDPQKEDVHTNIESFLIEKYGYTHCGKLHTARSRNDQSSADTKLFLRDHVLFFAKELSVLSSCLQQEALRYQEDVIPGFTHHQHAMVTTFGHILMSFAVMLFRDAKRFLTWYTLHNTNPLGNVVSYGTSFPIDQEYTTNLLGFDAIDSNSLDQITNRWEAESDFAFALSVCMNHFSHIAQTLMLFSTQEFGMVQLADSYATGSSIMPQKKNPDPLEVIKAKASYTSGQLQSLLSMGKANFIGYNRDSQWTKYILLDLIAECQFAPKVLQGCITTLHIEKECMAAWCQKGLIGTTTLLEQMVSHFHIPFRKAKTIVEKAVRKTEKQGTISFETLDVILKEEQISIPLTPFHVQQWQDPFFSIKQNTSFGGPNPKNLHQASKLLIQDIESLTQQIYEKELQKTRALAFLQKELTPFLKD